MKIAVVAANGKAGKKIVAEALSRNLDVTAIVRGENKSVAKKVIVKDILSLTKDDLKNFDVVIDCFGAWKEEDLPNKNLSGKSRWDFFYLSSQCDKMERPLH